LLGNLLLKISTIQKVRQTRSTTKIVQLKIGKAPKNTKSTTKLSYIRELPASVKNQHQTMLTRPEIFTITNNYIGVSGGYLGDFSYRTHEEFYLYFCDLNISPEAYEGTTRQRFLKILEISDAPTQAKILKGVLKKYPVDFFPEEQRLVKEKTAKEIEEFIRRLESGNAVATEILHITNATVERAIQDTKILIETNGATSGVDRIHTALHGYLKEVCRQASITLTEDENLTQVFKKLKSNHPALQNIGARQSDIDQIINSFSNTLDKLNPIRNKASLSHPNEELLEEDEAMFVVNSAQTVLNYLNRKFKN
jgi:Abortive infection C-terminus